MEVFGTQSRNAMAAKATLQVDRRMWPSAASPPKPAALADRPAPHALAQGCYRRQPTGGGKNSSESMLISAMRVNDFTDLGWSWF
jgi:hypothetical protein